MIIRLDPNGPVRAHLHTQEGSRACFATRTPCRRFRSVGARYALSGSVQAEHPTGKAAIYAQEFLRQRIRVFPARLGLVDVGAALSSGFRRTGPQDPTGVFVDPETVLSHTGGIAHDRPRPPSSAPVSPGCPHPQYTPSSGPVPEPALLCLVPCGCRPNRRGKSAERRLTRSLTFRIATDHCIRHFPSMQVGCQRLLGGLSVKCPDGIHVLLPRILSEDCRCATTPSSHRQRPGSPPSCNAMHQKPERRWGL